jgi:hypothetical protein
MASLVGEKIRWQWKGDAKPGLKELGVQHGEVREVLGGSSPGFIVQGERGKLQHVPVHVEESVIAVRLDT